MAYGRLHKVVVTDCAAKTRTGTGRQTDGNSEMSTVIIPMEIMKIRGGTQVSIDYYSYKLYTEGG